MPAAQDLLTTASLLTALVLVSRFRIPFAGRLLIVGAALMTSSLTPDALFTAGSSLGVFLGALLLGALVHYGASTELDRRRPRLRRMALLLAGLLFVLQARGVTEGFRPSFSLVAALITCVWAWWPAPLFEAWARLRAADADMLWLFGMRRWAFVALGRFLAVTAVVFPFFLFLHDLEGDDLLDPKLGSPKVINTEVVHRPVVWFWPYEGAYLKPDDLDEGQFYAARGALISEIETLRSRLTLSPFLGDDGSEIFRDLQERLKDRRVTSLNYKEMLKQEEEGAVRLYYLTRLQADPTRPPIFVVDTLAAHTSSQGPWKWLFLAYGMLGFILLWRRGGESRLGRWIGLWFIGTGTLTLSISQSVIPMWQGILYRMSETASQSPLATLVCTALSLLILASMSIVFLCVCFATCAAIWTEACWPNPRERRGGWARRIVRACKVPLVASCMALLFYLPWFLGKGSLPATVLGIVLFTLVSFGAGYLLQERESIQDIRIPVNRTAGFVLLLVQGIVTATVVAGLGSSILYVRHGRNLFRAVREMPEGTNGFLVHGPLRTHLAQSSGFLDLHRLADEWRVFFYQFELHRIRKATRGRFLLPVCLGGSLRALLVIPEAEKEVLEPVGEPLAGDIAQLGLIAARLRGNGNVASQVA